MAEETQELAAKDTAAAKPSTKDEVSLELMKFIAVTTGYGKGSAGAGYGAKASRSAEDHAEALLQLFERCRTVVGGQA
jgi:hypothetical protein